MSGIGMYNGGDSLSLARLELEMRRLASALSDDCLANPKKNRDFSGKDWTRWGRIVQTQFRGLDFTYGEYLPKNDTKRTEGTILGLLSQRPRRVVFFASAAAAFAKTGDPGNRLEAKRAWIAALVWSHVRASCGQFLLILTTVAKDSGVIGGATEAGCLLHATAIVRDGIFMLRPWVLGCGITGPYPRNVPNWLDEDTPAFKGAQSSEVR